jgi:hypothetical protein
MSPVTTDATPQLRQRLETIVTVRGWQALTLAHTASQAPRQQSLSLRTRSAPSSELEGGRYVAIARFAKFSVDERAAREARNPRRQLWVGRRFS